MRVQLARGLCAAGVLIALIPVLAHAAAGRLQFSVSAQTVPEGAGEAVLRVTRLDGSDGAASVRYSTQDDTARALLDYTPATGVLTWASGDAADKLIRIGITNDALKEKTKLFLVSLDTGIGARVAGPSKQRVFIQDNDGSTAASPYGDGVLGAVAQFFADLYDVVAALVAGAPAQAVTELQYAQDGLVANLNVLVASKSPEQAVGLDVAPDDYAQRLVAVQRNVEAVVLTGAQIPGWSQPAAAGVAQSHFSGFENFSGATEPGFGPRNAHAGVFFYPPNWRPGDAPVNQGGMEVSRIAAYAYRNRRWVEIRVQVDEKYPYFLANGNSTFSFYSGIDPELTYAWDTESWGMTKGQCSKEYDPNGIDVVRPGLGGSGVYMPLVPGADPNQGVSRAIPDPVAGLDNDDEVVFMASDAGELYAGTQYPGGWQSVQVVQLNDPLNPAAVKAVYLVARSAGSSFNASNGYVSYQRKPDADQWIDRSFFADSDPERLGSSNTNYGANLSGTVCHPTQGIKNSTDRFPRDGVVVSTSTYRWEASGRWMVRDLRVREPGVSVSNPSYWTTRPDLIDRWKGRAFQQSPDSTISVVGFEDEQVNWEANSSLIGERCGAVRCLREVWGADSGTNVTKTETFYRDAIAYRYHVRVHPIPPDGLYTSWDYNRSAMVSDNASVPGGRYYTVLRPQGVPVDGVNDEIGSVDNLGGSPAFFDAADPSFNLPLGFMNWEQVSGKGNSGSLVYLFEMTGATSLTNPLVVPYYRDDACLDDGTGDDPVQRPWPGETSTDSRVIAGYADLDGSGTVECREKQGAYAAHGVHYFFTHDTDNAMSPATTTEIDGTQWQFMVPTAAPKNLGDPYANVIRARLVPVVAPVRI